MDNLVQFNTVVGALLELGEERDEMVFWKSVFPSMSPSEQEELLKKFETELQTLKNLQ